MRKKYRRVSVKQRIFLKQRSDTNNEPIDLLKDAAFLVGLLTALSYFVSFAFKNGYMSYYGLDDLTLSDIGVSDILEAIEKMIKLVWIPIVTYIIISYFNNIKIFGVLVIFYFMACIQSIFITPLGYSYSYFSRENYFFSFIEAIVMCVVVFVWIDKRRRSIIIKGINKIISLWRSNNYFKVLYIVVILLFSYKIFFEYGYTQAESKTSYMTIEFSKNKPLVIIDQNDHFVIVSELNQKKNVISDEFELVKLEPQKGNHKVFKQMTFKKGLKVKGSEERGLLARIFDETNIFSFQQQIDMITEYYKTFFSWLKKVFIF